MTATLFFALTWSALTKPDYDAASGFVSAARNDAASSSPGRRSPLNSNAPAAHLSERRPGHQPEGV